MKKLQKHKLAGWGGVHSPVNPNALRTGLNKAGKIAHKMKSPFG